MNRRQINKTIRAKSRSIEQNKKCFICGTKKNVENHHIIKVEELTRIAWHNGYDTEEKIEQLYMPTENLCNDHHNMIHSLNEDNFIETDVDLYTLEKIVEILQEIDLTQVPEDLYEDYRSVVDDIQYNIVFNFIKNNSLNEVEMNLAMQVLEGLDYEGEDYGREI